MRFFAAPLLLFLSPVFAQTAPQSAAPPPQITPHDLKEADALGSQLYANSGVTGLVLVVVRGDQVFIRGYGETAPGSNVAPSKQSVIRLCSLTKIFTTDVLTKLAADGTVHLDDPLQKYAPQGVHVPEKDAPITLVDLATHTSGFDREIGTAPRHTPHFTYPDYATRWQWLPTAQLKFTPGTQAWYSNIGYDLLSDALANAAHTSYPALLWSRTLKPLGMWETTFYPNDAQCAQLMRGPHNEGPCTTTENTDGSSGLYSTPADMAKWLRYLAGPSTPAWAAQSDAAHAVYKLTSSLKQIFGLNHAGKPAGIGLGWMHLGENDDPSHIIEKTGGGAGFTTYIAIHPASHTALFVAATDGPPRKKNSPPHEPANWQGLFRASTDGLLALAGLPPLPERQAKRIPRRRNAHGAAPVHARRPVANEHSARAAQPRAAKSTQSAQ
jgi:D-alanyl-D-alanine-carboxypeptidase/D-alanyl-D-alanine-endopeptidase